MGLELGVTMPHLALPLRLTSSGRFATVAQDSADDVAQSLGVLFSTRPGERTAVPDYGTADPQPLGPDVASLRAAAAVWEPRGTDLILSADTDLDGTVTVTIDGSA